MPDHQVGIPLHREGSMANNEDQGAAKHAAASDSTAPVQEESITERIARLKREAQEKVGGQSASPTSGQVESPNKSTTAGTAMQDASNPQRVGDVGPRSSTTPTRSIASQPTGRVSDGSLSGERVRVAPTGVIPESNDVMLGDQSTRKDGPKSGALVSDGSSSPHDASSEGGSRQQAAHDQVEALKTKAEDAKDNPAFQAAAKERTI